jgi:hypothetical protein
MLHALILPLSIRVEEALDQRSAIETVTSPLVSLHVASNAESLSAVLVRALERLFSRVRVAVDSKA